MDDVNSTRPSPRAAMSFRVFRRVDHRDDVEVDQIELGLEVRFEERPADPVQDLPPVTSGYRVRARPVHHAG